MRETDLQWRWARLAALEPLEVFAVLRLRQAVFVLEQRCLYPDIDEVDLVAWHLLGTAADGRVDAYLRLIPPTDPARAPAIGRVVTRAPVRGRGLGRALMSEGLRHCERLYPGREVRISAQAHLQRFYGELGFQVASEPYLEDGIAHIAMVRVNRPE